MHVESRLRSTRLGDAARHGARFLVLWLVTTVATAAGVYAVLVIANPVEATDHFTREFTTFLIFVGAGSWLTALVLTIAWRSSEVSHG